MPAFSRSFLIVKFGALGDVVRTAYLLPALAAEHPEARIYWLTSESASELLRFNPYLYGVATPHCGFTQITSIAFDFALSLDDEVEVLALLANLHVGSIIGSRLLDGKPVYCEASAPWFDMGLISRFGKQRADKLKRSNQREHHTFLEEMLHIRIDRPTFFNSPIIEARVRSMYDRDFFHVGLNSGAGARWPAKELRITEAVALVSLLARTQVAGKPTRVWLLGGQQQAVRHAAIRAALPLKQVAVPGVEQNLLEFAAQIKALDFLISSDTLALHLAIAQSVANLSFYAPTSAAEIGTFGTGAKVVSQAADYCDYRPDTDNSTITAERLYDAFKTSVTTRVTQSEVIAHGPG